MFIFLNIKQTKTICQFLFLEKALSQRIYGIFSLAKTLVVMTTKFLKIRFEVKLEATI